MRRVVLGLWFGAMLFLVGGIAEVPAPAACHGCAVLTHAYPGCTEAVQGGYVCG